MAKLKDQINRRSEIIEAQVVSAKALSDQQIAAIQTVLSKKIEMQVEAKAIVDPEVIGGFYVLVAGRIFDGTVKTDLQNMKARLKRGIYE